VSRPVQRDDLPELAIISTGGTIASRVDYRTGAVTSQFSADDILRAIPLTNLYESLIFFVWFHFIHF
jgi:L-asparaginase/Glu-tRNA(Gln) amidotransferase subunit D